MPNSPHAIRTLRAQEVSSLDSLLRAAFRSEESYLPDLLRYFAMQPDGFVAAWDGDAIVGVGAAFGYGGFGYIGLMAVSPEAQGRGIGRALLSSLLDWLRDRGTSLVALDGTEAGLPLYRSFGFESVGSGICYARTETAPLSTGPKEGVRVAAESDLDRLADFDEAFFGARRPTVLRELRMAFADRFFLREDARGNLVGYACAQAKRIGPWVAETDDDAVALLERALTVPFEKPATVLVSGDDHRAIGLLSSRGFAPSFDTAHMIRGGRPLPGRRAALLARASFATG